MTKKPAKKRMGRAKMKRTRGGGASAAFIHIEGIKGETEERSGPSPTLWVRNWEK